MEKSTGKMRPGDGSGAREEPETGTAPPSTTDENWHRTQQKYERGDENRSTHMKNNAHI
jgi:hypothetical protein